MKKKIKNK